VLYKYEGWARGADTPTHHHVKTLVATSSSRSNSKALAACEVLAHQRVTFHLCTCELREGATAVIAALIVYDDMMVFAGTTMRRRRS
jgi:hypothetical protein